MFDNDLGILVFLEKLSEPTFWTYSTDRFSRLLVPKKYFKTIQEGANTVVQGLPQATCQMILALRHDLINLYALNKRFLDNEEPLTTGHPIANEFARKMIELDRLFMEVDGHLSKQFEGELLLRTRFFAGKNKDDVYRLTQEVLERGPNAHNRFRTLGVHQSNQDETDIQVTADQLQEITEDRLVKPVDEVRRIITRLTMENLAKGRVVTTNLREIAEAIVNGSLYRRCLHSDRVVASTLDTKDDRTFRARPSSIPVFGEEKRRLAEAIAEEKNRQFLVALGDSARNDGPMIKQALRNGGIAVFVGPTIEEIYRKFNNLYQEVAELPHIKQRMICVETADH